MEKENSIQIYDFKDINCFDRDLYFEKITRDGYMFARFNESIDFLRLISLVGIPHSHNGNGVYLWDIKPQPGETSKTVARSQTMEEFVFHTDCAFEIPPPKYVALYVVHPDENGGGISQMIDFAKVIPQLKPESVTALKQDFKVKIPKEFMKDREYSIGPIIIGNNQLSYRRDCIVDTDFNQSQRDAIDDLEICLSNTDIVQSIAIPKGTVFFLDNRRFLHARTEIKDLKRHLQRVRYN